MERLSVDSSFSGRGMEEMNSLRGLWSLGGGGLSQVCPYGGRGLQVCRRYGEGATGWGTLTTSLRTESWNVMCPG